MITGADILCRILEDRGVSCVFGVPGTQTILLHEALRRSRIRVVVPSHELAASFMANGYYRASGRIAPIVTIPGPGFTYALTGLAEALHDSAALLHIVGCAPGTDPRQHFQALDQRSIAGPLVKGTHRIDAVDEIVPVVEEALRLAVGGEPGPVLLEWTREALEAGASPAPPGARTSPAGLDGEIVERAAGRLAASRRLVLLVGQGCADAPEPLRELAELLGAPVVTTGSGRGVLPEDHPLALGFDFVRSAAETANELFREADLVLALGCKLGASATAGFRLHLPQERLVRVDTSLDALQANYPADLAILATAEAFLASVTPAVRRLRHGGSAWSPAELTAWRTRLRTGIDEPEPVVRGVRPSTAAAFFSALRAALPRDGIVVADSGLHQTLLRRHFDVLANRGLIFPGDFQSMGFGLPAAIGARLAQPGRPVVAVIGDGGFAMSGLELLTAVRERIPITVVVFVDGALNRIRLEQLARYGHSAHVDLLSPDFAALAAALGARYLRCEADAEGLLRGAIASDEVTLVEVSVGDSAAIHLSRVKGLAKGTARRALGPGRLESLRRGLRLFRRRRRSR
jgi:acetolactate synthase-1/2/3 large subunit